MYYLREALQLAGGVVGTVIVMMLVLAGIQYITSSGDSANVKAAKNRITNAITALVLFMFMVAILQFIVPGGIFVAWHMLLYMFRLADNCGTNIGCC